jgi:hypothetical protein
MPLPQSANCLTLYRWFIDSFFGPGFLFSSPLLLTPFLSSFFFFLSFFFAFKFFHASLLVCRRAWYARLRGNNGFNAT